MLTVDQLGPGWTATDTPQPPLTKASLDPQCPIDIETVEFTVPSGPLVQVALVRADGDQVAYLIVSGDGDAPIDLARALAAEF